MAQTFVCQSPVNGDVLFERNYATDKEIDSTLELSEISFRSWSLMPLDERILMLGKFIEEVESKKEALASELCLQMGRPIRYAQGEIEGFAFRGRSMLALSTDALSDIPLSHKKGFTRFIRREPLGVVLSLAPWNYPYLTAVNSIIPALVAGNTVILKHAEQTALVAEALQHASDSAGLPKGVFQILHASHEQVGQMVADNRINFVSFTGSVQGGHAVSKASSRRFIGLALELGGKDPAYVRADADFRFAVDNLVDGVNFNSGQSCCAVERIYVDKSIYNSFVDAFVEGVNAYQLGDPTKQETTLGPLVRTRNANRVKAQIDQAVLRGAKKLIDVSHFEAQRDESPYLAPQVLIDVDHSMTLMTEETFGPCVGIMSVKDDEEAIRLMNDSPYGLTASIWTQDVSQALNLGAQIESGTLFMNRCDYLDPELPWVGIKDSGRGCTLSHLGFDQFTRPKSFHLRHN